jgi:osmotically-inducible protein OsmY
MSRHDDDPYPDRPAGEPETRRDPYEANRQVRSSDDPRAPRRDEQPARYGGEYRADVPRERSDRLRGDARYGWDTEAERHYATRDRSAGERYRERGRGQFHPYGDELERGQNNSGYEGTRAYSQGSRRDEARGDLMHASWTQEHDYEGPRYSTVHRTGAPERGDQSSRYSVPDTYGGAGFRQQGKRYWFDESDQRSSFRGTRPRGYERSDERLCELACERLTEADLDASDIGVKVEQGVVTLEGSVPARWMKHAAEDLIDDLGGARDIRNQLRVGARGTPAAATPAAPSGNTTPPAGTGVTGNGDTGGRSRH